MREYFNYHKHSHISNIMTVDSNTKPEEYAKRYVELGQKCFSTCEHGGFGDQFISKHLTNQYGLKCLAIGEFYIVPNPLDKDKTNNHIIVAPLTNEARKLCNYASSHANIDGYYYKPRLFIEDLLAINPHDVLITSACVSGLLKNEVSFEKIFMPLYEHFGNNIMLEVQAHNVDIQKDINCRALKLHEKYGIPLVAACDSHYIDDEGRKERDELLLGKGIHYDEEDGFILDFPDGDTLHDRFVKQGVLSEEQINSAMQNSMLFTEAEDLFLDHSIKMPTIYPELSLDERLDLLKKKINVGFSKICKEEGIKGEEFQKYKDGIRYEMKTIEDTNDAIHTADYLLLNEKVVKLAQETYGGVLTRGGRGSAGSFYINRVLGLTQLDRFKINLPIYPDRFMSTARLLENRALPDWDANVESQEPFVKATRELLGEHGCYPMVALGCLQEKEAFKNVCRSKGIDFDESNEISQNLEEYEDDPKWHDIIEESKKYAGTIVSVSPHPCAHLLDSKDLLYEYGVIRVGDVLCVLVTSGEADEWKLLKNDYLIVSVWHLIAETFRTLGRPIMPARELLAAIKDDERVWNLFRDGMTCTLNQVDSTNGTQQAQQYGIRSFEDGALIAAAIRPSFDSWREIFLNRQEYSTGVKQLDDILAPSKKFILFQESLMSYFQWLDVTPAESIGLIKKISKKKIKPEDFAKLEDRIRESWIKKVGSDKGFDDTWHLVQSCMSYGFCVSGDTIIQKGSSNSHKPLTIAEMYHVMNNRQYALQTGHKNLHEKYKYNGYGTALSMYDDNLVRNNHIKDIFYMGKQQTYCVTTASGASITCTMEHRFPTPNGVMELNELNIGDSLYIKGTYQKRESGEYNLTNGPSTNSPHTGECGFRVQEFSASRNFDEVRERHAINKDCCEICGAPYDGTTRFELHHKDFNRKNNNKDNYQWLCTSCHKKLHYEHGRTKRYEKGIETKLDKIVSIEKAKFEDVYSIEMADPAHTYITDSGLITCNCSAHAAATSLDMCYGAYLKVHYPLQYYTVCLNTYQDNQDKTMRLTHELDYFGITLKPIVFRHSMADYSFDEATNTIYQGIGALKYMSASVADELYMLRDNEYASFIDALPDITATSIDTRQLTILIKIGFFEEFGGPNKLLKQYEQYQSIMKRKTYKKSEIESGKCTIPEYIIAAHAGKATEKQYSQIDQKALLADLVAHTEYPKTTVFDRMDYELEVLDYITTTVPDYDPRFSYIINIDGKFKKKYVTLYQIRTGKTATKKFEIKSPIKIGDIICIDEISNKHKWRKTGVDANGKPTFERLDETEQVVTGYRVTRPAKNT